MTRKQAVLEAIRILSNNDNNREVVNKLEEMLLEVPLSSWTKKSILDSIETFAIEHNNTLPTVEQLTKENGLPSNTVINAKFHISSIKIFYKKYFCGFNQKDNNSSQYRNEEPNYFINTFKSNYSAIRKLLNLRHVDYNTYNKYKEKNTPHLSTIIKNCNCKNYYELLVLCGYKKEILPISSSIEISYNDADDSNESLSKIILNGVNYEIKNSKNRS